MPPKITNFSRVRSSNFELLRILAMFFIVCSHFSVHGASHSIPDIKTINDALNINFIFLQSFSCAGNLGVNFFVLITGYFLCKSTFKISRISRTAAKTWIYSISILLLSVIFNINTSIKDAVICTTPFAYWFINTFILLILISPLLNIIITRLDKRQLFYTILIGYILYNIPILNHAVGPLAFFALLYLNAAYIRFYISKTISPTLLGSLIVGAVVLIFCSIAFLRFLTIYSPLFNQPSYFTARHSPFIITIALCTFILFKQWNLNFSKTINFIASGMFGVYLLHDNPITRSLIWQYVEHYAITYTGLNLLIHAILAISCVFIICTIVDMIFSLIIDKLGIYKYTDNLFCALRNRITQ